AIQRLIDKMQNDKIGIVVFAGEAYVQLPITADYGAAKMFLNTINPSFIQTQGTVIGKAIELAVRSFSPDTKAGKAIIIITDGEDHEGDPVKQAKLAREQGIYVHTIGMGTVEGAPIPIKNKNQIDFHRDRSGNVVMSKLNPDVLREIAMAGEGFFVQANNTNVGLNKIYEAVQKMEKTDIESKVFTEFNEKYHYFVALALFFLLLEFIILDRKNRLLKNIRIFNLLKI
ncbi:MAG: VWA domain-containing protein, partial [Bacteroidales bacterium]